MVSGEMAQVHDVLAADLPVLTGEREHKLFLLELREVRLTRIRDLPSLACVDLGRQGVAATPSATVRLNRAALDEALQRGQRDGLRLLELLR